MKSLKSIAHLLILSWFFIALFANVSAYAQAVETGNPSPLKFPTPQGIANQLFYLQRDPNTNTIICELNVDKNGEVIEKDPIKVYWLRYGEEGEKEDLSYIQRKFAYGIQAKAIGDDQYELRFVSHKNLPMYLMKSAEDKKYHVYVTVNKKKIQLERIFLRIQGGSFWLPNVKYVELKGINTANKTPIIERIKV
ncbi:DUF4833 domain-containing protein [Pedobacter hiemivivus]|uniref:DUF4833 domain-containing protein n=1 Tax=Pedobacter hiemivivus TaxID=2530454 RepID=A0A4U1G2H6_9SPHI|nr:DUF4833 domain-containing protein [Pedobacter hiemivivus]TKC57698.1 DUF4833 domain-containing protein [Pedobacter hiemivivus]